MGYSSKEGRRPFELASKASHHHIINDDAVRALLTRILPKPRVEKTSLSKLLEPLKPTLANPIEHIIATDGGYTEVVIDKSYPSRLMHFMQFGALYFRVEDLLQVEKHEFISPEDMAKLKNIERLKLALPTKNMRLGDQPTLALSVLEIIAEFFRTNFLGEAFSLMDTLKWFLFRRYKGADRSPIDERWFLAHSPYGQGSPVWLDEDKLVESNYTFPCPETGDPIRLTDVFRLQEVIGEETGATGILGYLTNVVEHLIIVHLIRSILATRPELLRHVFFMKDGPCGFFGQTANLHRPMADLVEWLQAEHDLFLVGLEKSGAFVEHAAEIREKLNRGEVLIPSTEYIYDYILPGQGDKTTPYGSTTNYGQKVIFKTSRGEMHVVSIPCSKLKLEPRAGDLMNLSTLLTNVEQLHCDMYDSALFPVALVNKLVSLAAHPSQVILQKFAKATVS